MIKTIIVGVSAILALAFYLFTMILNVTIAICQAIVQTLISIGKKAGLGLLAIIALMGLHEVIHGNMHDGFLQAIWMSIWYVLGVCIVVGIVYGIGSFIAPFVCRIMEFLFTIVTRIVDGIIKVCERIYFFFVTQIVKALGEKWDLWKEKIIWEM